MKANQWGILSLAILFIAVMDLLGLRPAIEGREFSPGFILGVIAFIVFLIKKAKE